MPIKPSSFAMMAKRKLICASGKFVMLFLNGFIHGIVNFVICNSSSIIIHNAMIAKRKQLPICQDTGMVVVYIEVGQDVRIKGDINKAVADGVSHAYKDGYFRKSVVRDPLVRVNTDTNLPPIIYTKIALNMLIVCIEREIMQKHLIYIKNCMIKA